MFEDFVEAEVLKPIFKMESQPQELGKSDQAQATSVNVEMSFGDYITSEYSILKTIFSHLSAKHLQICGQVCREWKAMVNKMGSYSVECYHADEKTDWPEFNKFINPALIFYFDKYFKYSTETLKAAVEEHYDITNVPFHQLLAANPIYTPCSRGKVFPKPDINEKSSALVFIPQIPGLTIKKYEFDKSRAVLADEVEPLLTAKGVLLLSQSSSNCVTASNRVIHHLYFTTSKKKEVRRERPCLAGGLLAKCCKFDSTFVASPVVALALEGDNVTIQCDIHKTSDHDPFFRRLSENAGPIPENAVRFAFIFNCVGRYNESDQVPEPEQLELTKFRDYFPNVPYFGFWSYGEFCIPDSHARNMTDPKKIKIDRHIRYLYSACASYMIVTVQH